MEVLRYMGGNGSTVAMAALQGPMVSECGGEPARFRYEPHRFVCAHCCGVAEEIPLGVPVSLRLSPHTRKLELVVRDRVALKCLVRYMQDQSAAASGNSSFEHTTELRTAMLTEIYGCTTDLATHMPLAPSRADLPPFRADSSTTIEQRTAWALGSIAWHRDHAVKLNLPNPDRAAIFTEKRTICIDRHVRPGAPAITAALRTLLPRFVTATPAPPAVAPINTVTTTKSAPAAPTPAVPKLDAFLAPVAIAPAAAPVPAAPSSSSVAAAVAAPPSHRGARRPVVIADEDADM